MINSDDFFDSVNDIFDNDSDDGYQTDTDEVEQEDVTEPENAEEPAEEDEDETQQEAAEEPESDDTSGEVTNGEADKDGAEGEAEADRPVPEHKFVVKVNKEMREVSYQDAPAWIQKGMDYDRVKGQLESAQQNEQALQAEVDKTRPIIEILELAAEQGDISVEELLEHVHVGLLKGRGMTEAEAKAEIRAAKAEKQVKNLTEKQQTKQQEAPPSQEDANSNRAQREFAEFRQNFPDVQLNDELVEKLAPDVQRGMSLTSAYLKMENARLKEEAEQQKLRDAAAVQNKKNRAKTPGSQRDSGGNKTVDLADIFERELFK